MPQTKLLTPWIKSNGSPATIQAIIPLKLKPYRTACAGAYNVPNRKPCTAQEIAVFSMLGAVMYASKMIMEIAPNIHLLGVFTIAFTVVYRKKALYPIYIYVLLNGIFCGFAAWWIPYLYVWTILWGAVMLLPGNIPRKLRPVVYMAVCAVHGFLFGTLYAPAQAHHGSQHGKNSDFSR